MTIDEGLARAEGLDAEGREAARELARLWRRKRARNELRDRYYLSHVPIKDLGIAISPEVASRLRTRVDWPAKAVSALADRSVFEGYACADEAVRARLDAICAASDLRILYKKCLLGELKHCCGFWEVTADAIAGAPVVSAYPATAAAALWDDSLRSIRAGLVVVASRRAPGGGREPTAVRLHTASYAAEIRRGAGGWAASVRPHSMGRPLMEPMAHQPTLERPFGRSRITRTVMSLTDDAIRQRARMEVAAEAAALPQMWLLGTAQRLTDPSNRYDASMGAINEVTKDEDGDAPTVWQSAQLSMQPHTDYMRALAAQFSSATNVPLSELGVTTDNPSSAEAIYAAKEPLVVDAQNLNAQNGVAMRAVALMALAVEEGTGYAEQAARGLGIEPRFRNPAMPSVVSQADAMIKIVTAVPWFAESDVLLEELGFTADQIQRLRSDRARSQSRGLVAEALREAAGGGG